MDLARWRTPHRRTATAFDGGGAIAAVGDFSPDVVLMEIGMPMPDGYEAARVIRQKAGGKKIVLVAVTGWGGDTDRRLSREAGFGRHLVKPVIPTELFALLSSLKPSSAQVGPSDG